MGLATTNRLILYALGEFYASINQPLTEKPVKLRISKVIFIHLLEESGLINKHQRTLYNNLETLEKKKLITYERKMIRLTKLGISELATIQHELEEFSKLKIYFHATKTIKGKWQTILPE